MYQINRDQNDITKLDERLFGDLGFREREHLQEWIAKNPDCLGEDLLIIQKEFDGFIDTRERLDLLAIDKNGDLVIIENKLDDTGRNVSWQALKYASYCSTLTTEQIIDIFQKYLIKYCSGENAKEQLLEFLEVEESNLLLNSNDQRIIFVANYYRKEVTSTVLWLLNHGLNLQCFRATPFSKNDDLFLQIEQIIPLPETEEFTISIQQKENEVKRKQKSASDLNTRCLSLWSDLKSDFSYHKIDLLDTYNPLAKLNYGFRSGKGKYNFCLGRDTIRIELYFKDDELNNNISAVAKYKNEIESKFGKMLIWDIVENRKATRIKYEISDSELYNKQKEWDEDENRQKSIKWFRKNMIDFYNAINPYWERIKESNK